MQRIGLASAAWLAVAMLLGCAQPGPPVGRSVGESPTAVVESHIKHITLGALSEPGLYPGSANPSSRVPALVHSGLSTVDDRGVRVPVLAEAVPTLGDGLWKLLPDGRMETTWHIREDARWHDGAPLTSDDLLFTLEVGRDREMSAFQDPAYRAIQAVTAPDTRTLTITWQQPYIDADSVLGGNFSKPLPRHLLKETYRDNKAAFLEVPYWTREYVGAGPYRIRTWTPGASLLLEAFGEYVLGRPKIDEIEVQIVPDANALAADLLAGTVDLAPTLGSVEQGVQVRDRWNDGTVLFHFGTSQWIALYPQFLSPQPGVVADVRFRRALLYAIDRQEIADTLEAGVSPVPHSLMNPNQPAYRDIESRVRHYDYDPRLAAQMLEELGYGKGPDGTYRDVAGQRLELELRSGPLDRAAKTAEAIGGHWQRLGIATTTVRQPPQRAQDFEYLATFPAFLVRGGNTDTSGLPGLRGSLARLPSNGFRAPGFAIWSRYTNPDFDALIDRYLMTVPIPERTEVIGEIISHVADEVIVAGIYYDPEPIAVSRHLVHFSPANQLFFFWNAQEWDLRGETGSNS